MAVAMQWEVCDVSTLKCFEYQADYIDSRARKKKNVLGSHLGYGWSGRHRDFLCSDLLLTIPLHPCKQQASLQHACNILGT